MVARRAHNPEVEGSSPFPATKRRKQHRKGAVFSFEYEREGLEPEKARAGVQSAGGTLGRERSEPSGGRKIEGAAEETGCERSEVGGQVLSPQPNEENSTERVLFFSFEYEREGLEPEKARAGVQSITTQSC